MSNLKKVIVYIVEPLKGLLFFIVFPLLDLSYQGKEDSPIYVIWSVASFLIAFALYLRYVFFGRKLNKIYFLTVSLFLISFSLSVAFFGVKHGFDYQYLQYFYFFLVYSLNPLLWGIDFGRRSPDNLNFFVKWFEPFVLLISGFSFLVVFVPVLTHSFTPRGEKYQSNSYYCAFAFGCLMFYLFNDSPYRFPFFRMKVFKPLILVLMCLLPITVISTGGRGGFVLLTVNILLGLFYVFSVKVKSVKNINSKRILYVVSFLAFVVVAALFTVQALEKVPTLRSAFEVTISYLTSGGFDITQTSGRDVVYGQALYLINERPAFGYGFLDYMPLLGVKQYPHNLFLEVLLQGGVMYLIVVLSFLVKALVKVIRLIKMDDRYWLLLFVFAYPLVKLMFSGTYISTPLFWFCLAAILCSPAYLTNKENEERYNN